MFQYKFIIFMEHNMPIFKKTVANVNLAIYNWFLKSGIILPKNVTLYRNIWEKRL
jgi:hypothetical protein